MAMLCGVQVVMGLQRCQVGSSLESPSAHPLNRGWSKSRAKKLLLVSGEGLKVAVEEEEIVLLSNQLWNLVQVEDPGFY